MPADFFISYTQADARWAAWVAWLLEENGYQTIIQQWDFTGGNFVLRMDDAHRRSRRTISILSPQYLAATFTQPEWAARFREDPTGAEDLLIPIRVKPFEPGGLWGALLYVDLVDATPDIASDRILSRVRGGRAKPTNRPHYPDVTGRETSTERPSYPTKLHPSFPSANPQFVRRPELVREMRGYLSLPELGRPRRVVLSGGIGCGKSQLATQFYYENAQQYDYAVWVNAENPSSTLRDYLSLGSALGVDVAGISTEIALERSRAALEGAARLLVIFDNAVEPASLSPFLPRSGPAHVIVTSRLADWNPAVTVGPMSESQALEVIAGFGGTSGESSADAARLARTLEYIPIRLAQARDYIRETQVTPAFYLDAVLGRGEALLPWREDDASAAYDATRRLADSIYPDSGFLLDVLSNLAPEPIPRSTVAGHEDWGELGHGFHAELAIAALTRTSLLRADFAKLTVHRLEREVTLREQDADRARVSISIAVSMLHRASIGDWQDAEWRSRLETLTSHMIALLDIPAAQRNHPIELSFIADRVATSLQVRGLHRQALPLFRQAVTLAEGGAGVSSSEVAIVCNDLGVLYRDMGRHRKAMAQYSRAVSILRRTLGPASEEYAIALNNLGLSHLELGEPVKAEPLFREAMAIDTVLYGGNHRSTAIDYYNLAQALRLRGGLEEAASYYSKALRITRREYGSDHPTYARRLRGRALLYEAQGRFAAAERLLLTSRKILRKAFGESHYEYARLLQDLCGYWTRQGAVEAAREGLLQLADIYKELFGRNHPYYRQAREALKHL